MIRPSDALVLAGTKLRARKVRTTFTILIAGLLFGLVASIVFISDGALQSTERMMQESMTGRYIVSGWPMVMGGDITDATGDPALIEKALAEHKQLVADKKAEAKRLGIDYDAARDPSPVETIDGYRQLVNGNAIADRLIAEKSTQPGFAQFESLAKGYHPVDVYKTLTPKPKDGTWKEMRDGVEKLGETTEQSPQKTAWPDDINDQAIVPQALVSNYVIADHTWKPDSGHIPVVVSQKRAAALTGFTAPKDDAPAAERLSYNNELRKRASGKTFEVCYRNSVSSDQVNEALRVAKEIERNKNDKNYQKPSLQYGTPEPRDCAAAPIIRDVRTADEKQYADKERQLERKFGGVVDPVQQKLTYEVVGVSPNGWADSDMDFGLSIKDMVTSIFMTNSFRLAIPEELYSSMSNKAEYSAALSTDGVISPMQAFAANYFTEFTSAEAARAFIKEQNCEMTMNGCKSTDKPFVLSAFGSNSIALDDAKRGVTIALLWISGVVTVIAAVIAGLTIGRTIADGRRETAVFRAIGFKRFDISQVYITYTMLLSLLVMVFALATGVLVALLAHNALWLETTVQAQLALGLTDASQRFTYIGVSEKLVIVCGAVLVAGLIGMLLPLMRNVRRNPIRDMRDE